MCEFFAYCHTLLFYHTLNLISLSFITEKKLWRLCSFNKILSQAFLFDYRITNKAKRLPCTKESCLLFIFIATKKKVQIKHLLEKNSIFF